MRNTKKFVVENKTLLVVIILALLLVCTLTFSFAWLNTAQDDVVITSVESNSGAIDDLSFTSGNTLSFSNSTGNLSGSTIASATLNKHPLRESGNSTYNISIEVMDNNFVYTTDTKTPELILTIIDPNGNEITENDYLDYVTSGGVSGFDVTTFKEALLFVNDFPIETTSSTTHEWTITLTLVDLESNQELNNNKTFNANINFNGHEEQINLNKLILGHNDGIDEIETNELTNMRVLKDDYGLSYYYISATENNWVYFGGFYWKIVRINGDGSIRMIYAGKDKPTFDTRFYGPTSVIVNTNYASTTNDLYRNAESSGYMYTLGEINGNSTDSNIKIVIDNWFVTYLIDYQKYLSDTLFCNDRSIVSGTGIGANATIYSASQRNSYGAAILTCENTVDAFTVDDEVNGNGVLMYPVATLSADEHILSSGMFNFHTFWLMTPFSYSSSSLTSVYYGNNTYTNADRNYYAKGIKPVINLKSTVMASGEGTYDNPYVVEGIS